MEAIWTRLASSVNFKLDLDNIIIILPDSSHEQRQFDPNDDHDDELEAKNQIISERYDILRANRNITWGAITLPASL